MTVWTVAKWIHHTVKRVCAVLLQHLNTAIIPLNEAYNPLKQQIQPM